MKVAALDLGSNSFLCLIAEIEKIDHKIKISRVLSDEFELVRLGQNVQQTKSFNSEALDRARLCLGRFKKTIDQFKPDRVLAMATSAARDVRNQNELFKICESHGIPVEIIPGDKEAQISFQGAISARESVNRQSIVIDVGGGSTEIIMGQESIEAGKSINIGAVRITEMFFKKNLSAGDEDLEKAKIYIESELQKSGLKKSKKVNCLGIGVAGTPTELARVSLGGEFDLTRIDGYQLSAVDLNLWVQRFKHRNAEQINREFGIVQGRADIILAGTLILLKTLEYLHLDFIEVSTRGVRFGVALEIGDRYL